MGTALTGCYTMEDINFNTVQYDSRSERFLDRSQRFELLPPLPIPIFLSISISSRKENHKKECGKFTPVPGPSFQRRKSPVDLARLRKSLLEVLPSFGKTFKFILKEPISLGSTPYTLLSPSLSSSLLLFYTPQRTRLWLILTFCFIAQAKM